MVLWGRSPGRGASHALVTSTGCGASGTLRQALGKAGRRLGGHRVLGPEWLGCPDGVEGTVNQSAVLRLCIRVPGRLLLAKHHIPPQLPESQEDVFLYSIGISTISSPPSPLMYTCTKPQRHRANSGLVTGVLVKSHRLFSLVKVSVPSVQHSGPFLSPLSWGSGGRDRSPSGRPCCSCPGGARAISGSRWA